MWSRPRGLDRLQQPQSPLLRPGLRRKGNDWTHDHGYPRFRHDRTLAVRRDSSPATLPIRRRGPGRAARRGRSARRAEGSPGRSAPVAPRSTIDRDVRQAMVKPAQRAHRANRLRSARRRAGRLRQPAKQDGGEGGRRPAAAAASPRRVRSGRAGAAENRECVDEEVEKVPQRQRRVHAPTPSRPRRTSSRSTITFQLPRSLWARTAAQRGKRSHEVVRSPERRPLRHYVGRSGACVQARARRASSQSPGPAPPSTPAIRSTSDSRRASGASPTSVRESGSPAIAVSADASNPPTLNRPSSRGACAAAVPPALLNEAEAVSVGLKRSGVPGNPRELDYPLRLARARREQVKHPTVQRIASSHRLKPGGLRVDAERDRPLEQERPAWRLSPRPSGAGRGPGTRRSAIIGLHPGVAGPLGQALRRPQPPQRVTAGARRPRATTAGPGPRAARSGEIADAHTGAPRAAPRAPRPSKISIGAPAGDRLSGHRPGATTRSTLVGGAAVAELDADRRQALAPPREIAQHRRRCAAVPGAPCGHRGDGGSSAPGDLVEDGCGQRDHPPDRMTCERALARRPAERPPPAAVQGELTRARRRAAPGSFGRNEHARVSDRGGDVADRRADAGEPPHHRLEQGERQALPPRGQTEHVETGQERSGLRSPIQGRPREAPRQAVRGRAARVPRRRSPPRRPARRPGAGRSRR